jgi:2-polyprenyl-3-methyl-5-hydroxy-6-metoxy-1,4-benzoquinol methylase
MKINEIRPENLLDGAKKAYQEDVNRYKRNLKVFVARRCPGCNSDNSEYFCKHNDFIFDRCTSCFSVFMNPGPTEEVVADLYENSSNYAYWAHEVYPLTRERRRESLHRERAEFVLRFAKPEIGNKPLKVLELGAGTGDSLSVLKETSNVDIEGYAIEPNPDMWKSLKENEIRIVSDIKEIDHFRFDAVIAYEVLEHTLKPRDFIKQYSKLLKRGGHFLLSTPNAHSVEVQYLKGASTTIDIEHISLLTPAAIHNLAAQAGLIVAQITTPGKFDLELLQSSISNNLTNENLTSESLSGIQKYLQDFCFSSHMKIALTTSEE